MSVEARRAQATGAAGAVLLTLCAAQFLMALDSSVMNVSIATVADDLDTTVTGIQTAIVLYTLVMAMLMVTGGKIGSIIGRNTFQRPRDEVWDALRQDVAAPGPGPYMALSPGSHGTDGFFAAVLQRHPT